MQGERDGSVSPKCPICGKPAESQSQPFCSKRCADVDLQRWLAGRYAIPVVDDPERPEDEADAIGEP